MLGWHVQWTKQLTTLQRESSLMRQYTHYHSARGDRYLHPPAFILTSGEMQVHVWENTSKVAARSLPIFCTKEFHKEC
jgi:hypothetical protein